MCLGVCLVGLVIFYVIIKASWGLLIKSKRLSIHQGQKRKENWEEFILKMSRTEMGKKTIGSANGDENTSARSNGCEVQWTEPEEDFLKCVCCTRPGPDWGSFTRKNIEIL